jgi:O-antigen/teichoic acid export membrane protein
MSQIRKKGLITTSWIYIGFIIGAINTYLFSKNGWFLPKEYGLSRTMMDIGFLFNSFSTFGSLALIIKFFPYYKDRLTSKQNDLFSIVFFVTLIGFCIVALSTYFLEPLIIRKYGTNAPELVKFFYWTLFLAFGMAIYGMLEYFAWNFGRQITTNILREIVLRLYVSFLMLLYFLKVISLDLFFKLFSFQYIFVACILFFQLMKAGEIQLTFTFSKVTKRFKKIIVTLMLYGTAGNVTGALRMSIDSIVLASLKDLQTAGIFTFANFAASLLQAPMRSLASITLPLLSQAWKDKNLQEINRIYKRSSINLLLFALFIFGSIWLAFEPAIDLLDINPKYLQGKYVLLLLGIMNIVDMGTGVNAQIIATSSSWRFEFYTNVFLSIVITALSFSITKYTDAGILGPAIAQLIGIIGYNTVRIVFLKNKFNLFPFSNKTLIAILLFAFAIAPGIYLHAISAGIWAAFGGLLFFILTMPIGVIYFQLSPDVLPIVDTLLKRLGINKKFEK